MRKYCVMTNTGKRDRNGLRLFRLGLYKDGNEVDHMLVTSGQPGHQALRKAIDSVSGSAEPTPEGHYLLGDEDVRAGTGINWAGGVNDYETLYKSIASPIWTGIHPADWKQMHPTDPRMDMGVHWDNPRGWPGTLGCVGLLTVADLYKWVAWNQGQRVAELFVDYKLGFVRLPQFGQVAEAPAKHHEGVIYSNDNGQSIILPNGLPAGQYRIYSPASGWPVKLVPR